MLTMLSADESLGLLDLGSHVGSFAAAAAHAGRRVAAVEPIVGNAKRVAKSAAMNKNGDGHVTLVMNAISNARGRSVMMTDTRERKFSLLQPMCKRMSVLDIQCQDVVTIWMDDLIGLMPFRDAIIKTSLLGHEPEAFEYSDQFFKKYNIRSIIMDWRWFRSHQPFTETQIMKIRGLIEKLKDRGFVPYNFFDIELKVENWLKWTDHIYWIKNRS
jgi:FkbM family methyltransferase